MSDTIHVYKDEANEWRWNRVAPNGNKVSDSGEGYSAKEGAVKAAEREAEGTDATVVIEEG